MATTKNIDELWARAADAHARGQAHRAQLGGDRPPAPGDAYLWVPANDYVLAWVVVGLHPTDPGLAFVVPADGNSLTGLADVLVREPAGEPMCLRCGRSQVVPVADLEPDRRFRVLGAHHVRRAQRKIRELAVGPLGGTAAAWEAQADPDYQDWIANVTAAVLDAAARREKTQGGFLMTRKGGGGLSLEELEAAFNDTAAVGALSAAIANEDLSTPIPFPGPGDLRAVPEADGARVLFEAPEPAAPPAVFAADAGGVWHPVAWTVLSDRTATALVPWVGEQVRLRAGSDPAAPEIVVAKS